jgi:MFS family permease
MTCRPIALSIISPVWVRFRRPWTAKGPLVGALLSVLAMCVFAFGAAEHAVSAFIAGNVIGGLGLGVAQPELTGKMINSVPAADPGLAGGLQAMLIQVGSVLGIGILGGIAAAHKVTGHAPSYVLAYLIGAGGAVVAVVPALLLRRMQGTRSANDPHGHSGRSEDQPGRVDEGNRVQVDD